MASSRAAAIATSTARSEWASTGHRAEAAAGAEEFAATLNLVVFYVCLPAAILLYAPRIVFSAELLDLIAAA